MPIAPLLLAFAGQPCSAPASDAAEAWIQEPRTTSTTKETSRRVVSSSFDYSYVEVELGLVDIDGVDDDLVTFGLNGSYGVAEQVFVFGSYQAGYADVSGVGDLDTDTFLIGVGVHHALADSTDLFAKLALVHAEADLAGVDDDDDGFDIEAGLRFWATDAIELDASVEHVNLDDSETGVNLAGRYYFTPPVSAGLKLSFFDDSDAVFINLRYAF